MHTLTITELAGDQVLVSGRDVRGTAGEEILDGSEYFARQRAAATQVAADEMDAEIQAFYAPLAEAADRLKAKLEVVTDPLLYVVEQEEQVGTPAAAKVVRKLGRDEAILRALETGHGDRLIWVKEQLVITAAPTSVPATPVEDAEVVTADAPQDNGDDQGTVPSV